ncbi:MAG: glutamate mutase [Telmatospirillum sp.]|nr:glutamate mutase [Telmatospirillum sp.]
MIAVSIDIGSTWTKGAVFRRDGQGLTLDRRIAVPTTTDDLSRAFSRVLDGLVDGGDAASRVRRGEVRLSYSSSAKGGLAVAALGLVPEITLESARVAAYSAGAKVTRVFSYRLTRSDIRSLEAAPPDILLFAGGTDGGHVDSILANAEALARSSLDCSIVYAGNRALADDISDLLAGKDLVQVPNVLPSINAPDPDPAREAIRKIFLSKIVKGKGLDVIVGETGVEPLPTPYSVYEFAKLISARVPGWSDFILLDMGGATTDVYSAHRERPAPGTILRGLPEPEVKRTVEGDLGLRVSAEAASDALKGLVADALDRREERIAAFADYIARVSAAPDYLPEDEDGQAFDAILAGACVAEACGRHAGRAAEVYTPEGKLKLQTGRDLTGVTRVIGSGGWLSRTASFDPSPWFRRMGVDNRGRAVLLPSEISYFRDEHYVFPLLANVARDFPEEAAKAGIDMLVAQQ